MDRNYKLQVLEGIIYAAVKIALELDLKEVAARLMELKEAVRSAGNH